MADRPSLLSLPFALGFVANFLHSLAFYSYLHLPGLLRGWDATELTIGFVMGTASAAGIVCRPWVGQAVDRRGRKIVVVVGGLLHLGVTLAYLTFDTIGPWLLTIRLAHGVAIAMLFTVLFTIAADVAPESRRTEGIAIFGLSGILPMSVAGLVGDAILARGSYQDLFTVVVCTTAAATAVGMLLPESRRPTSGRVQRSFAAVVMLRTLRPLWLVGVGFALAIAAYFTFVKTFVLDEQVGSVGGFFTAYTAAAVVLRLLFGWVPDRIGARRALVPSMLAVAGGLVLLANAGSDTDVLVAGVLTGTGHAWVFPIASALVVQRAAAEDRGAALAMFTALFDIGLLVGGPMYGAILQSTDYATMFTVAAAVATAATVIWLPWDVLRNGNGGLRPTAGRGTPDSKESRASPSGRRRNR